MGLRAQSAIEFSLLLALLLLIFLPIFYFFISQGMESRMNILESQIEHFGRKLLDESRELYYLGIFNKEILSMNMPENILNMTFITIQKPADDKNTYEYYLKIDFLKKDEVNSIILSPEVPLTTLDSSNMYTCAFEEDYQGYAAMECKLDSTSLAPGHKDFKLEVVNWQWPEGENIIAVSVQRVEI
ncbi:hypothetical protein JXA85_06180 [Candidatus Woesearchaeota archaeon]|nr:hypothetical protein [Candidatus Woesearchaeota archaeon]